GKPAGFYVIEVGYEDCNVAVETDRGKYVAKIFSKTRNREDIARYGAMMEAAVGAGVNHPLLIKTESGAAIYSDAQSNGISMVMMDFIEGDTFFDLGRAPDSKEYFSTIEQAARINSMDYHPPYVVDSWAIPNAQAMFERVKQYIQTKDIQLITRAMARYAAIPVNDLPHCFVHGDFSKANVIKGNDGKMYVLDFSVANWYPRIQELAVIAANLFYNENDPIALADRCDFVAGEYDRIIPLADAEKRYLYDYALAGAAMEFMGPYQEKFIHMNSSAETEYRLEAGRNGLRSEFANKGNNIIAMH
ncbi:MAG: phosphotransferase, partial [Candidatus Paceibacterota bacterium]